MYTDRLFHKLCGRGGFGFIIIPTQGGAKFRKMIFFELFSTAFTCIFYGVLITAIVMAFVYFVLRQASRGIVSTVPFFVVGILLFAFLTFQQTLMVGAITAKGYVGDVAMYVEDMIEGKDKMVERTSQAFAVDCVQSIKEQFPEFSLFVDVDEVGEKLTDVDATVAEMKENTLSSLNYYILRRVLWSLGLLIVAIVIACLLGSGVSTRGKGSVSQHGYSAQRSSDFRSRTYRRRRF